MADFGKATVMLELDGKKFDVELSKISKNFEDKVAKMAEAPKKANWAEAATGIKSVFYMVKNSFGAAFSAMSSFVSEYEAARAGEAKLLALMKNRQDFSQKMYSQHVAFARELQSTTNFADESIIDAIAQFQTFGNISQNIVQEATRRAADIAQTTGQDIKSVAILMGKALDDPLQNAKALRKSGVLFDEAKLKSMNSLAERQAFLLAEIKKNYSGAAEGGQNEMSKFKNTLSDIKEEIGKGLMPVFAGMAKGILAIAQGASSVIGWFNKMFSSATNLTEAEKELNIAFEKYNKETGELDATEKLINRYDELSKKTTRTTDEQKELANITEQISQKLPTAISGWDAYGKKLGIVSDEARKQIEEQKKIQQELLGSQIENSLSQMEKAMKNYQQLRKQQGAGLRSVDVDNANSTLTGGVIKTVGIDTEAANKIIAERQKMLTIFTATETAMLKYLTNTKALNTVEDANIKLLHERAKELGKTRLELSEYAAEFRRVKTQLDQLGYSGLGADQRTLNTFSENLKQRMRSQGMSESDDANSAWMKQWTREVDAEAKRLKALQNRRNNGSGERGLIDWAKEREKINEYLKKLNEINMSEVEIKIKANFDEFEKAFKKFFTEDKFKEIKKILSSEIEAAMASGVAGTNADGIEALFTSGQTTKMQELINEIALKTGKSIEVVTKMVENIQKQNAKVITDNSREASKIVETFTGAADTLAGKIRAIDEEHRKAVEDITNKEIDLKKRAAMIEMLDRAKEQKKTTATVDSIKTTFESIKSGFDSVVSGIKAINSGKASSAISGAGGMATGISNSLEKVGLKGAGAIGGAVGAVSGLVGGIVSLFEDSGETAQEKWQRVFDLTQARYNFELAKEQALTAQIQKRMEVYSYLEKLYRNNDKKAMEEQMKILQKNIEAIVGKFAEKGTITIQGVTYDVSDISAMQAEQQHALLEALTQNEAQFSNVAKTSVEYNMQQLRNAIAGGTKLSELTQIARMDANNPKVKAYNAWVKSLRDTGYTGGVYSLWDLLDIHGNDGGQGVGDLNQNMQEFMAYFNNAAATADALSGDLETLIDQTDQLAQLEENKTNALKEQLNLQLKISDEVIKQLRALGNDDVNRLLDQYTQLETDIAQGKITGDAAYSARAALLDQITSAAGTAGASSDLTAAMGVSRSGLLKEYDPELWAMLAGLGDVPIYGQGTHATVPHLAIVGDVPERIIPDTQFENLMAANGGNTINIALNNPVVRNDGDIKRLAAEMENVVWKTLKNIENRRGKKF